MPRVVLELVDGEFAVCRLAPAATVPKWADSPVFSAIVRTEDELSIVCPAGQIPAGLKYEAGWSLFKFKGPFAFTETGILASVLAPLAAAKISILTQSTFDTDYLLIKAVQLQAAILTLTNAGHLVHQS